MRAGRIFLVSFLLASLNFPATAETITTKTYSYFKVGGRNAGELDAELSSRGPQMKATGTRHPGATKMKFSGSVTYEMKAGAEGPDIALFGWRPFGPRCSVRDVEIKLDTTIILPSWTGRRKSSEDLALIWDTLSRDIKRHEERHAEIARQYARRMEEKIAGLYPRQTCEEMQAAVAEASEKILAQHDKAQAGFDRSEAANYEKRMSRLLQFRLDAMNGK